MYHLQVVFMACVALRLAAFLALDVFRLVFIMCFALIFFKIIFIFVAGVALRFPQPLQRVSLSGWFVYGIFCSSFSFLSLCHVQSSIWYLLLLFIQFLPFGIALVLYFAFSILCGPCFFYMRAPSHIL